MPRYLIEVHHSDVQHGCQKALHSIDELGCHFVLRAEWGCHDGVHTGWLIVDVPDRETACGIVPPELRDDCRVIQLNKWTRPDLEAELKTAQPRAGHDCNDESRDRPR